MKQQSHIFPSLFNTGVPPSAPPNIFIYHYSEKAFIFSICNKEGLPPFKSTLKAEWARQWATMSSPFSGPSFGGAYDLELLCPAEEGMISRSQLGCYYTLPSGVQDPNTILAGTSHFSPDELVVFYLD